MKDIYVIGNGGFAKEVYYLIKEIGNYNFKGFIDYQPKEFTVKILETELAVYDEEEFIRDFQNESNICLAVGVGEPQLLAKLAKKFEGFEFPNLIHPSVRLDTTLNSIGIGNIITSNVIFTVNISIGNFNVFNLAATIGHDTIIGNYNVINPAVNISGGVVIGDMNLLGVGSIILQYKSLGNNNTVGASSLVTKNIDDDTTVVGIPAKPMNK